VRSRRSNATHEREPIIPNLNPNYGLPLVTRDRRALDTYRALDVDVELLA